MVSPPYSARPTPILQPRGYPRNYSATPQIGASFPTEEDLDGGFPESPASGRGCPSTPPSQPCYRRPGPLSRLALCRRKIATSGGRRNRDDGSRAERGVCWYLEEEAEHLAKVRRCRMVGHLLYPATAFFFGSSTVPLLRSTGLLPYLSGWRAGA